MPPEQDASGVDVDLARRLRLSITSTLDHLEAQLRVVGARLAELAPGGFDPELAKAGSSIARSLKDTSGELRQLERHDKRMTLTPEQRFAELLKYVHTLDPMQRAMLSRTLDDLEATR